MKFAIVARMFAKNRLYEKEEVKFTFFLSLAP